MTCEPTSRVAGPCSKCGAHPEPMHVTDEPGIYCAACCPVHGAQMSHDWGDVPIIVGEQENLF